MIWRGVEGNIARNGLTVFYPHLLIVLKLTRRFTLRYGRAASDKGITHLRLTIDLRRDHRMYRSEDMDTPSLMCRRCDIWHDILIKYKCEGSNIEALSKGPPAFCSGKLYRWG